MWYIPHYVCRFVLLTYAYKENIIMCAEDL